MTVLCSLNIFNTLTCINYFMHNKWLKEGSLQPYHSCILGLEEALQVFRRNRTETVKSKCIVDVLFKVEISVHEKHNIRFVDNNLNVVYVHLKDSISTYGETNDEDLFDEL